MDEEIYYNVEMYYERRQIVEDLRKVADNDTIVKVAIYFKKEKAEESMKYFENIGEKLTAVLSGASWIDIANKTILAAIILTLIVIRQKGEMMETEDYKKAQAKLEAEEAEGKKHKVGFIPMVKGYWKTLLLGCGTRWVDGTFYNIFIVWILSYCINWLGMPLIQTYIITIIACIFKIPFTLFGGWCAQKLGNTRTFVIGALASAVLSIPTLKVIELSKGNLAITIIGIVLGWSIAYNLIWAVISSLWSSYFETEVRYSGISFVYHVPSFLVAGMVPTICTLLINYGKGDTIYVGIYSTVVALISAACALALKARHDRGEK